METKLFEIRDRFTFISIMATRLTTGHEKEHFLLRRAGFGNITPGDPASFVLVSQLSSAATNWDPYEWGDRTMKAAHFYIVANWGELKTGDVVDVEYILGETAAAKKSEMTP